MTEDQLTKLLDHIHSAYERTGNHNQLISTVRLVDGTCIDGWDHFSRAYSTVGLELMPSGIVQITDAHEVYYVLPSQIVAISTDVATI